MKISRIMRGYVALLLAAFCLSGQVAKRAFTFDRDVETAFQWHEVPRWDGEFLVGYINNHSSGPVLVTIDRDGRRDETLFTLIDAGQINFIDAAAAPNGEIAAIGSALGWGATFLARIAPDRKSQVITRVWPYCPMLVTFAPDGSVWTIGHLKDEENTREIAYHVLRRFDPSGKLLGSRTLNVKGNTSDETSYLRSSRDRVGWFTRGGEYIEFSMDGSETARYDGPAGADERDISGVALSPENEVVAGRLGKGKAELDILGREQRTWIPVSLPPEFALTWTRVLGFDGTTLVIKNTSTGLRRFKTK